MPRGVLTGYVAVEVDPTLHPAGSYRAPGTAVRIQRIVLEGPGGRRELAAHASEPADIAIALQQGRDDISGSLFSFVNLPAGEHELTVYAEGYEPHVSRHRVTPGQWTPAAPIMLRRGDERAAR